MNQRKKSRSRSRDRRRDWKRDKSQSSDESRVTLNINLGRKKSKTYKREDARAKEEACKVSVYAFRLALSYEQALLSMSPSLYC